MGSPKKLPIFDLGIFGALAEWLGRSLQSFVRGFDSLTRLQNLLDDLGSSPKILLTAVSKCQPYKAAS